MNISCVVFYILERTKYIYFLRNSIIFCYAPVELGTNVLKGLILNVTDSGNNQAAVFMQIMTTWQYRPSWQVRVRDTKL
jgi:hypothetical protein